MSAVPGPAAAPDGSEQSPVLHVDMDAFFAAVALRGRPELRDAPVVVGGGHRGVVLAASYPARAYGVRSGMPGTQARRLCPGLISLPVDHREIAEVSRAVMDVLGSFTPLVEVVSVDEAFLDVRGAARLLGSPLRIAGQVRAAVRTEQGLACSVGVAPTRSVAKLASRRAKPDGVVVVAPEQVAGFLRPLPVGELWGVGERTAGELHRLGVRTVADLADVPLEALRARVGRARAAHLHDLAHGTDRASVASRHAPAFGHGDAEHSMGAQHTLAHDVGERAALARELLRLSERVARRMRRAGYVGRTVVLTVRFTDFRTVTRSRTLPEATAVTREVHATALALYDALELSGRPLRLVGVRVEGLRPAAGVARQLALGEREHGWPDADRAVDRVAGRFGNAAVGPASLLPGR